MRMRGERTEGKCPQLASVWQPVVTSRMAPLSLLFVERGVVKNKRKTIYNANRYLVTILFFAGQFFTGQFFSRPFFP